MSTPTSSAPPWPRAPPGVEGGHAGETDGGWRVMRFGFASRDRLIYLGIATVVVYGAWLGAPYLRSIVTRDAAVTTWITVTSSPIAGLVDLNPLYPGQRVGADGIILKISNPRADRAPLTAPRRTSIVPRRAWPR